MATNRRLAGSGIWVVFTRIPILSLLGGTAPVQSMYKVPSRTKSRSESCPSELLIWIYISENGEIGFGNSVSCPSIAHMARPSRDGSSSKRNEWEVPGPPQSKWTVFSLIAWPLPIPSSRSPLAGSMLLAVAPQRYSSSPVQALSAQPELGTETITPPCAICAQMQSIKNIL